MRKLQSTANIGIFEKSIDCIGTFVFSLISESGIGFYQRTFFQEIKTCFKTKNCLSLEIMEDADIFGICILNLEFVFGTLESKPFQVAAKLKKREF